MDPTNPNWKPPYYTLTPHREGDRVLNLLCPAVRMVMAEVPTRSQAAALLRGALWCNLTAERVPMSKYDRESWRLMADRFDGMSIWASEWAYFLRQPGHTWVG